MVRVKAGVIGCGNISGVYLKNGALFPMLDITMVADLDLARAEARAREFGIARFGGVEELLNDPEIQIAINLTTPGSHAEVGRAALDAGKSVYNEKPLALDTPSGGALLDLAKARGLRVGCAPDTFLGGGLQTCRELIDQGAIGRPVGATAFMMGHGHEGWHPDPAFYYQQGGGPMFDMGPYYLTALVSLLGPVRRVTGSAQVSFEERTIGSEPKRGQTIRVEVPTHVTGVLDFTSGPVGTITTSFDVWAAELPFIEIYGAEGTLSLPDPNSFGGPVRLWQRAPGAWREVEVSRPYTGNNRGLGVADLAAALQSGRPHRAGGELALHVLEIMEAIHEASRTGRHVVLRSSCERPAPFPAGLQKGEIDP